MVHAVLEREAVCDFNIPGALDVPVELGLHPAALEGLDGLGVIVMMMVVVMLCEAFLKEGGRD